MTKVKDAQKIKEVTKYCIESAGEALNHFINNIDVVESDIGNYRNSSRESGINMVVISTQTLVLYFVAHLLSTLDVGLEVNSQFNEFMGKTPVQILKGYLNKNNEGCSDTLEKLKGIISNKHVLVPFKPDTECIISIESSNIKSKAIKISSVIWKMDRETNKFQGKILIYVKSIGKNSGVYKLPFEEYGKSFKIESIERSIKNSNIDRESVKFNRFGIINPLVINDGRNEIALDCCNLYIILNNSVNIIGKWGINGTINETDEAISLHKTKAYKYLKTNLDYIEKHKRFIAPFGLVESNKIRL
ncbi:MAG: hypothetical protein M1365_11960 [Actinobacteria bacterium]|nr:hypothetical protein [Actinomycetota bacterium]